MAKFSATKLITRDLPENAFSTGENFANLFEETAFESTLKEGSVVTGVIIGIEKEFAIVDIGLKTEGRVPLREFGGSGDTLKVGDSVEVYLERIENRNGEALLSREKALREESWVTFEKIFNDKTHVEGTIFGRVKGGFTVDLKGAIAFLPGSQVDIRPVKDITPLMGIAQPFQILKMDRKRGNIVVSRRAVLEETRSEARSEMLALIEEGQVLDGNVKNITDYGAFIDLGSVDGLLHVTDISWKRVSHPSEVLRVGQTVRVKVIKHDKETHRVSLGMKQLEDSPWVDIESRYPVGGKFNGRVTNITDYGAFVELQPGIEGLVHVSEISWVKKNIHPSKLLSSSQEVEVMILDVDPIKHRISLGMKQCVDNPWEAFAAKHPVGSILEGEIKNIADFGIFVGLDSNIDGLVHVSDISWKEEGEQAVKNFNKGDLVKVMVLAADPDKERISLGIKQLESDPFDKGAEGIAKGAVLTVTVAAIKEDGIEVTTPNGLPCFIKRADLAKDRADQRPDRFAVGERVDVKVTGVEKASRKVSLSIKALEVEEHKKAIEEYGSADSGASLGDILGVALNKSKEAKK